MRHRVIRLRRWIIAAGLCAVFGILALCAGRSPMAQAAPAGNSVGAAEQQLHAVQRDLIVVLRQIHAVLMKTYQTGQAPLVPVLEAKVELMQAELDACDTDAQKIQVLTRIAAEYKQLEEIAHKYFQVGQGSTVDELRAKARRLETEIAIDRLRAKSGSHT